MCQILGRYMDNETYSLISDFLNDEIIFLTLFF